MTDERNQGYDLNEQPVAVMIEGDHLHVTLADGRIISTPLAWYPFLQDATPEQLTEVDLWLDGVWWPQLDEGLSVEGMLKGRHAPQRRRAPVIE